jgi:hypothetical protein
MRWVVEWTCAGSEVVTPGGEGPHWAVRAGVSHSDGATVLGAT